MPSVSPSWSVKVTPSTAFTEAICFWKMIPRVTGKCFLTSSTTRSSLPVSSRRRPSPAPVPPPLAGLRELALEHLRALAVLRLLVEVAANAVVARSRPGPSAGSVSLQIGITYGQRGWNRQPRGGKRSDGGWPEIWTSRSTSWCRRGSEPSNPQVYGWFGRWKRSCTSPSSWMRAAYMTTTSSATSATTPRSCVIMMIALPNSLWRRFIRSRIWACVVTSSAVVGSSAISRSGLLTSAIAIITRWRMPPENWCG